MKKLLLVLSLVFVSSWAGAYQLACGWVFSQQVEAFLQPDSPQRILNAIEKYKKIMKLAEFNHKPGSMDAAKMRLREMNSADRADLLQLVGDYYNEVKALKYNKDGPFKTFKRHIDLVISQEIDAPKFFRSRIFEQGKSLEGTLDAYYKKIQQVSRVPVLLKGSDVLVTALQLQERFLSKNNDVIVIYGSFVNGKAYAHSSDLDFAVINSKLEEQMRGQDLVELLTEFPLSEAQAHIISGKQIHSLGSMNPLVLIVKRDYIVLRVYENGLHNEFSQRRVKFDEFYF